MRSPRVNRYIGYTLIAILLIQLKVSPLAARHLNVCPSSNVAIETPLIQQVCNSDGLVDVDAYFYVDFSCGAGLEATCSVELWGTMHNGWGDTETIYGSCFAVYRQVWLLRSRGLPPGASRTLHLSLDGDSDYVQEAYPFTTIQCP